MSEPGFGSCVFHRHRQQHSEGENNFGNIAEKQEGQRAQVDDWVVRSIAEVAHLIQEKCPFEFFRRGLRPPLQVNCVRELVQHVVHDYWNQDCKDIRDVSWHDNVENGQVQHQLERVEHDEDMRHEAAEKHVHDGCPKHDCVQSLLSVF